MRRLELGALILGTSIASVAVGGVVVSLNERIQPEKQQGLSTDASIRPSFGNDAQVQQPPQVTIEYLTRLDGDAGLSRLTDRDKGNVCYAVVLNDGAGRSGVAIDCVNDQVAPVATPR